jgi:hypothetical protein
LTAPTRARGLRRRRRGVEGRVRGIVLVLVLVDVVMMVDVVLVLGDGGRRHTGGYVGDYDHRGIQIAIDRERGHVGIFWR